MMDSISIAPKKWFDLLVLSVISISIVAVVLLISDAFNPKTAVFGGMAIAVLFMRSK